MSDDEYLRIRRDDMHKVKELCLKLVTFKQTYIVYNRQLNKIFDLAESVTRINPHAPE